jgi:hypothetical protein
LVSSEAFGRLALGIRRNLYHEDICGMENTRLTVKPESYYSKYCFYMDWSLAEFMRFQYGEELPSLGEVVVITGSALYAQATTCEKYIKQTWPKSGMFLVQALDDALQKPDPSSTNACNGMKV